MLLVSLVIHSWLSLLCYVLFCLCLVPNVACVSGLSPTTLHNQSILNGVEVLGISPRTMLHVCVCQSRNTKLTFWCQLLCSVFPIVTLSCWLSISLRTRFIFLIFHITMQYWCSTILTMLEFFLCFFFFFAEKNTTSFNMRLIDVHILLHNFAVMMCFMKWCYHFNE